MKLKIISIVVGVIFIIFIGTFVYVNEKTPKTLVEKALYAANLGGDYLVRHINEDGSFVYKYDPEEDEVLSGYNMLRHAGTTYSLIELFEVTGESLHISTAEKALQYLRDSTDKCPAPFESMNCVYDGEKAKLGGNALAVLAFVEYAKVTGNEEYIDDAISLAKWIKAVQTDEGEFSVHILYRDGTVDDHVSEYYPGEAIYALACLYDLTKDKQWFNVAESATDWLIDVRDETKTSKDISHDHWLLYGLNELYTHNQSTKYVNHAKKIVDGIVELQHGDDVSSEWFGGYYKPPRSTPTATRSEGLVAAYDIFNDANEHEYVDKVYTSIENGIMFELNTFIDGPTARSYPSPMKAVGGFRESLESSIIRIDYVQHNISAMLGYARITEKLDL